MRISAVALCAVMTAGASEAATYYYVSSPYTYSNYDTDTPPVVTTGVLEIDETKVPGGLANNEIRWNVMRSDEAVSWSDAHPALRSLSFSNGVMNFDRIEPRYTTDGVFQFDADGEITTAVGMIGNFIAEGDSDNLYSYSGGSDSYDGPGRRGGHFSQGSEGGFRALWTTSAARWAQEIVKRVRYAVSNPPSNACRVAAADLTVDDYAPSFPA